MSANSATLHKSAKKQHEVEQTQQQQQKQTADLHVVTENGEQCFMWRANQLSYIAQDRQELPIVLANKFGPLATKLDLSYNSLNSFKNIDLFTNLSELILDNNNLEDEHLEFIQNLRLKTLSLNKNKLSDLYRLVNSVKVFFPNLEFLSLIGNPLCPTLSSSGFNTSSDVNSNRPPDGAQPTKSCSATSVLVDGRHLFDLGSSSRDLPCSLALDGGKQTEFSYQKYRYFIIYHLPNLRFLDSSPIGGSEKNEALRRFYWMESPANGQSGVCDHNTQCTRHDNGHNNTENNGTSTLTLGVAAPTNFAPSSESSQEAGFQLTIMTNHSEVDDPESRPALQVSQPLRGAFSRLSYRYTGKNSEGNRFIRNHDL